MTIPSHQWGDPAKVAEQNEARSCKGCKHETVVEAFGAKFKQCAKNRVFGTRCKFYKWK